MKDKLTHAPQSWNRVKANTLILKIKLSPRLLAAEHPDDKFYQYLIFLSGNPSIHRQLD
jgi:hypothetical protein